MPDPDPRFPTRPTHPDFDALCVVAVTNDDLVQTDDGSDDSYLARISDFVNPESLEYLATDRALHMVRDPHEDPTIPWEVVVTSMIAAAMIDGFVVGAAFERSKRGPSA